jgi:hypothetical protein
MNEVHGEDDKRMLLKHVMNVPGFEILQEKFDEERDRLVSLMLNPNTTDSDTLIIKGVLNILKSLSPMALGNATIKILETKLTNTHTNGVIRRRSNDA